MPRELVDDPGRGVRLEVLIEGSGPDVVLVPSAMRGAADFAHLQAALSEAGYRSLAINPRNAGASSGPTDAVTLRDVADDIALVVERLCDGPAHLVGHALGNVCVRGTASFRPEVVRSLTLMPCGGHDVAVRPLRPEVVAAVPRCHDEMLSDADRIEALSTAFFAPGNDASVWLDGWQPRSAGIAGAVYSDDPETWRHGGEVPILVMMPLNDAMMSAETGRAFAAELGPRVRYVELDHCGHAILPERPEAVARSLIAFLRELG